MKNSFASLYNKNRNLFDEMLSNNLANPILLLEQNNNGQTVLHNLVEKNDNKCATQVGKVRAQQLANGEPISVETIKRMYSYLSRAEVYYDASNLQACGTISFLLWGGKSGLSWSRNKLRELGLLTETEAQPSITSTYPGEVAKNKKKDDK